MPSVFRNRQALESVLWTAAFPLITTSAIFFYCIQICLWALGLWDFGLMAFLLFYLGAELRFNIIFPQFILFYLFSKG